MKTNVKVRRPPVRTHEGAPAKRIGSEAQLRRSVMSCLLWESEFYESGQSIAERIAEGVASVPLETAAAIALEARERMHLRHVPLLIVREMCRQQGSHKIGDTLYWVIQRADELAEFVALYWSEGKEPLSKQVKRGLAQAFTKFSAYDLAKYNRDGAIKLRDVLFMCHAKPKDKEQAAVWKQLVDGTLPVPDTWEVALSSGADKRETWERLIAEKRLGGLALLRNLRNMQQAKVPEPVIKQAIVTNPFNRVLPFRFIAAARYAPTMEPELEQAMFRGLEGATKLPGHTALLVDHSGSMNEKLSAKSDMTRFEAACGLAMLLREVCTEVTMLAFSDNGAVVPPRRGFALRDALTAAVRWGGTYTETAKQYIDGRTGYDRMVIITDEQSHQALSNPKGKGYVVNVASAKNGIGYGAWTHVDGWSESVVRYIQAFEGLPMQELES